MKHKDTGKDAESTVVDENEEFCVLWQQLPAVTIILVEMFCFILLISRTVVGEMLWRLI